MAIPCISIFDNHRVRNLERIAANARARNRLELSSKHFGVTAKDVVVVRRSREAKRLRGTSRRRMDDSTGSREARESSETMRDAALIFPACRTFLSLYLPPSLFLFLLSLFSTTAELAPAAARAPDCDRNSFVNYRILRQTENLHASLPSGQS